MTKSITHKTFSTSPNSEDLYRYLTRNFPGADFLCAYEAGFTGFSLHRQLKKLGIKSIVVNPADIPTTDKERVQKEDKRDSRKIAQALRSGELKAIHVPEEEDQFDRGLIRTRKAAVRDITRTKARIKSFLYLNGIDFFAVPGNAYWSNHFLKALNELKFEYESGRSTMIFYLETLKQQRGMLLRINRQIRQLSRTPKYCDNVDLLLTVPGVGMITAMTFLTELGDISRFDSFTQLCSYVGLVPSTHSSGDNARVRGITPRRNRTLRSIIIENSWVAIRSDPALLHTFETLTGRMTGQKAIIRIARKLLNRIVHVLRHRQPYQKGIVK
jgi:transposase